MEIPGIPESVTRDQICQALQALGIEPGEVRRLDIQAGAFAVYVEVYGTKGAKRSRYWDGRAYRDGDKPAMHRIVIPITDEPDPAQAGRDFAESLAEYEGRGETSSDGPQQGA